MTELIHFDAAKRELTLSRDIDEVKGIRDKAAALQAYLKQQGESREMQNAMGEIKLRAERRAGELLSELEREQGGNGRFGSLQTVTNRSPYAIALEENDLNRMAVYRFQKIASIPDPDFEQYIAENRASENGEVTSAGALRLAQKINRPEFETPPPPPVNQYRVIYADPPWRYEHVKTESRAIENQYPTMTLEQICLLPIKEVAFEDAVLFLWATSPKLEESMQVLNAWGFTYRTCMVWVKDKIGMGYYVRQQHELLLIGRRGNMYVPEPSNRLSSVIESPRLEHSQKPCEFYEVIETMYPNEPRIELFARARREGWSRWGNQV